MTLSAYARDPGSQPPDGRPFMIMEDSTRSSPRFIGTLLAVRKGKALTLTLLCDSSVLRGGLAEDAGPYYSRVRRRSAKIVSTLETDRPLEQAKTPAKPKRVEC